MELKKDYKNVILRGNWNEEEPQNIAKKPCPLCGYPMQLKYKKAYGLKLYLCTNEPEICGFMTNDYRGGKLSVQKCDRCRDGYLVVKTGNQNEYFLGCTNYKKNGTGCNNTISKQIYYSQMGYQLENQQEPRIQYMPERKPYEKNAEGNEKNRDIKPMLKFDESNMDAQNDYVDIRKAQIKPVLYQDRDLNEVVFRVLKGLQEISKERFYSVRVFSEFLIGANTKRVQDDNLDKCMEYGVLRGIPYEIVQAVIEWMLKEHYMLKTKERTSVLHSTYEGLHYSETITEGKLKKLKKYLEEEVVLWNW